MPTNEPFSSLPPRPAGACKRGAGLLSLIVLLVAAVVGLMVAVSLARHVRATSSQELTRARILAAAHLVEDRLSASPDLVSQLQLGRSGAGGKPPPAGRVQRKGTADAASQPGESLDELQLRTTAMNNARQLSSARPTPAGSAEVVNTDPAGWRDAWGTPLLVLAGQASQIGVSPEDTPFVVSAGPDRRFLTKLDNLYSYDLPMVIRIRPRSAAGMPAGPIATTDRPAFPVDTPNH